MAIHESKPTASCLFTYFFIDNNSFMDKFYSHCIYLSTYVKVMNVHSTGRPNAHDNNLFDIKGLSLWLEYAFRMCSVFGSKVSLACEAEVDHSISVIYKST